LLSLARQDRLARRAFDDTRFVRIALGQRHREILRLLLGARGAGIFLKPIRRMIAASFGTASSDELDQVGAEPISGHREKACGSLSYSCGVCLDLSGPVLMDRKKKKD
jgi:hypothetical protein